MLGWKGSVKKKRDPREIWFEPDILRAGQEERVR